MDYKPYIFEIILKSMMSLFILTASIIFTSQAWANKSSQSNQKLTINGSFTLAHWGRWPHRHPHWYGGARVYWGYPPPVVVAPYWGPWTPYWQGGVYCQKRCLLSRRGRVIRCRVSCF